MLFGRIAPPQAPVIDEDNAIQVPTVVDVQIAMALRKEGLETRHQRHGQPKRLLIGQPPR
jgi:hypothetical protein